MLDLLKTPSSKVTKTAGLSTLLYTVFHDNLSFKLLMPDSIPKKNHSASVFVDATLPLITMYFISFSVNMQVSYGMVCEWPPYYYVIHIYYEEKF